MKKVILTLSIALFTLASCQKEDDNFLLEKTQESLQGMYGQYDSMVELKNELELSLADAIEQITQLTLENESLREVVSSLEDMNEAFRVALNEAYELNAKLSSDLATSQADLDESNKLLSDALLLAGSLQSELNDAKAEINDLNDLIAQGRIMLSDFQDEVAKLKKRIQNKNSRIAKLQQRIANLKSK